MEPSITTKQLRYIKFLASKHGLILPQSVLHMSSTEAGAWIGLVTRDGIKSVLKDVEAIQSIVDPSLEIWVEYHAFHHISHPEHWSTVCGIQPDDPKGLQLVSSRCGFVPCPRCVDTTLTNLRYAQRFQNGYYADYLPREGLSQ